MCDGFATMGACYSEANPAHTLSCGSSRGKRPPGTFLSLVWLRLEKLVWVLHVDSLAGLRACGEGSF